MEFAPAATNPAGGTGIHLYMRSNSKLSALFLGAALVCGPALGWSQQTYPGQDSGAKQDMKNAGHETKNAAKDAGHGVKGAPRDRGGVLMEFGRRRFLPCPGRLVWL